jgi:hypothetical protein
LLDGFSSYAFPELLEAIGQKSIDVQEYRQRHLLKALQYKSNLR